MNLVKFDQNYYNTGCYDGMYTYIDVIQNSMPLPKNKDSNTELSLFFAITIYINDNIQYF